MKYIFLLTLALLAGCSKETTNSTGSWDLNGDLSDCKVYDLRSSNGSAMRVMRCPNSVTNSEDTNSKQHIGNVVIG